MSRFLEFCVNPVIYGAESSTSRLTQNKDFTTFRLTWSWFISFSRLACKHTGSTALIEKYSKNPFSRMHKNYEKFTITSIRKWRHNDVRNRNESTNTEYKPDYFPSYYFAFANWKWMERWTPCHRYRLLSTAYVDV